MQSFNWGPNAAPAPAPASAPTPAAVTSQPVNRGSIRMQDVDADSFIVRYPSAQDYFYVLKCPLCARKFESAQSIFGHLAQSDAKHLALFGDTKSFKQAVAVAGIPVTDCNADALLAHNQIATEVSFSSSYVSWCELVDEI